MKRKKKGKKVIPKYLYLGLFIILLSGSAGCKHNVYHIDNKIYCPVDYSFKAPLEKTWNATVEAVMESTTIDTMDNNSGYISTDIATIDGQEMNFMDHAFFGQTYKFTYDIRMRPEGTTSTRISTKVKLYVEQFMGISQRESHWEMVENYLREKLYRGICEKLFPTGNGKCTNGFAPSRSEYQPPSKVAILPLARKPAPKNHNPKIQTIQEALNTAGYNPGLADGLMGKKTINALKKFQSDNGLAATGKIDDGTYELLSGYVQSDSYQNPEPGSTHPEKPITDEKPMSQPTLDLRQEPESPPNTPVPPAVEIVKKFVTSDTADLLDGEDIYDAKIIATVLLNTTLQILSQNGEYYKVKYKGKIGYIHQEFVKEL